MKRLSYIILALALTLPAFASEDQSYLSYDSGDMIVVQGIDRSRTSKEDSERIFWAIGTFLGEANMQNPKGDRITHATFDELPVEVELGGTFHGIGAFVDHVERSPLLMKVGAIDVEAGAGPGTGLQARVVFFVIILKEQQP